ncbi:MAG: hypothetical protein P4L16_07345 [Chlamydiales bacterium]|nr:hypothetical protein [Chlamydiales bacterium]
MSSVLKEHVNSSSVEQVNDSSIIQEIKGHPAWYGRLSGLKAEKLLRGRKTPYLYILREGENEGDFYVTFVLPDLSIKHQPFVVTITEEGWHCENWALCGPLTPAASIDDVLHLIMHCGRLACSPKINMN